MDFVERAGQRTVVVAVAPPVNLALSEAFCQDYDDHRVPGLRKAQSMSRAVGLLADDIATALTVAAP